MKDIYQILKELNIEYIDHKHPPVFTCEEAEKLRNNIEGAASKNLFLRNRKGNKHYLVVLTADKTLDLKQLEKDIGESKLGFASEERLQKYLGCGKGSVSVFGLISDQNKEVQVFIDEDLWKSDRLHYHPPGDNASTLELSQKDLQKFLDWCGNEVEFIKI